MIAPSVLVSSSLRKLINKSTSSSIVVPSLCFINVFPSHQPSSDSSVLVLYGVFCWCFYPSPPMASGNLTSALTNVSRLFPFPHTLFSYDLIILPDPMSQNAHVLLWLLFSIPSTST